MQTSRVERDSAKVSALEEAAHYRILVEAVTDYAIYMLDPNGVITSWNAGAQRFKGYTADEIIGQHFSRFYTEEDRKAGMPQKALDTAVREGRFENEGWRMRKDGTRFWSHVIIDPIRGENGQLLGFAKITRDITEKKHAQEALERTREVLFQSQKMDAVGQLTGGVAHDFNNLLMAILGSLELLKRRMPNDPQLLRLLDNAMLGARRGATLTQRMLAFARRQELNAQPLELDQLVANMRDLLTSSLGPSAEIQTDFPAGLGAVVGDENQIELALLNLCVNARDAMPDGGRIRIGAREETMAPGNMLGLRPGHYVCLSVSDTGEGMSPEILARATEPFFTTKGVGKGTGLGLSMVHGMAEQMGGRLALHSSRGQGTTAEIWLPAVEGDAPVRTPAPETAQVVAPGRLRVLAVDDDRLVLFNTTAMLEDLGHEVVEAGSGVEALALLEKGPFDLVITDQAMPRMTGLQLLEIIHERWPTTPVILATGYAEIPGGAFVAAPKLSKPFTEQELAQALASVRRPA